MVFKINEDNRINPLSKIHCKNEEKELQDLLEKNNELLVGEKIDPDSPRKWLLIKREMPVAGPSTGESQWSIDFLFADQSGMPTFVECKRFKDTRSRREVIGQMMDYAANSQYYLDKETIQHFAEESAKKNGDDLGTVLLNLLGNEEDSIDGYFETVINNLKEGQIRLVFFLEEASNELKSIVEFLNSQMERTEVLIIEAKLFQNGNERFVSPSLFGYTEKARQVKKTISVDKKRLSYKWDEISIIQQLDDFGDQARKNNFISIYELVKGEPNFFSCNFGKGKTGSLSIKNNRDKSLVHIYTTGEFYLTAPYYFSSANYDRLLQLGKEFEENLKWRTPFGSKQYTRLEKNLDQMSGAEINKLKDFILKMGQMVKDISRVEDPGE
jgi:hypothetical protein